MSDNRFGIEIKIERWVEIQQYKVDARLSHIFSQTLLLEGRLSGSGLPGIKKGTPHQVSITADKSLKDKSSAGSIFLLRDHAQVDLNFSVPRSFYARLYSSLCNAARADVAAELRLIASVRDMANWLDRAIVSMEGVEFIQLKTYYTSSLEGRLGTTPEGN